MSRTNAAARAFLSLIAGTGAFVSPAWAVDLGGQVTVATDYVFRGVSQTMSAPALQGEISLEHDSGWYGYAWASNVDFGGDDGAYLEANFAAGYYHEIDESLSLSVESIAYVFPGTSPGYDFDYVEWIASVSVDDSYRLVIGYSNDVCGTGNSSRFYAAESSFELTERTSFAIELGYYDLEDAYDFSYGYAQASLSRSAEPFQWELSYLVTGNDALEGFYESTVRDRLVVTVSVPF